MKNIFLTGFMGCGKTTVAKALAQELKWTFIDTDRLIEKDVGLKVSEIFEQKGEDFFRRVEEKTIRKIISAEKQVVALGGGALQKIGASTLVKDNSLVYLETSPQALAQRLKNQTQRPLIKGLQGQALLEKIEKLLGERRAMYEKASLTIHTDEKSPKEIAEEIRRSLGDKLS